MMRRRLFFILIIMCLHMSAQDMISTDFWQKDKIKHSVLSFGISTATYTYLSIHKKHKKMPELYKRCIAFSTTMLIGALKEVVDTRSPNAYASWGDMGANTIGALAFQASITIPLRIRQKNKKKKYLSELN